IEPMDRPITVVASGIVASADSLRFGPPPSRSWRITITDLAREGTLVKKGDVLAKFDGSATDDRVRTKNAELNAKRSELESLLERQSRELEEDKVRLAAAESAEEKAARKAEVDPAVYAALDYKKLVEEKRLASDLYAREQQRGTLVEKVRAAQRAELEADIRRLESEVRGASQTLESFTIRAPRDGLVIIGTNREGQKLDVSDGVNPGIVVVELADPDALVIQAEVPEYAAASIVVGQHAQISLDASGGSEIAGKVVSVASIVRRQSQYSQAMVRDVTIELPDEVISKLRPGMSAKLTIVVDNQRDALAVPDAALEYRDGKPGVVVRGDGWRPVQLGRESAGMRVVETGLEAGEQVALR
ncbi:MAG: efflux RND transporter periplasmic adaptor subunit, partial [Woeseiaceae bacterium]